MKNSIKLSKTNTAEYIEMQLNDDYDFLVHFEVNSAIRNKDNSFQYIIDILQLTTSEEEIRDIIVCGISSQFKKSNNFKLVSSIHTKLNLSNKRNKLVSSSPIELTKIKAIRNVFSIENLMCSIFGYLDFESLLKCSQVNNQWLYDSYHPMSLTYVETKQLYRVEDSRDGSYSIYKCFYNINRCKNVESLKVEAWPYELNDYFRNLEKFLNISQLEFDFTDSLSKHSINMMNKMVEMNKSKLKKLSIQTLRSEYMSGFGSHRFTRLQCKFLQSVFLPNLVTLNLAGVMVPAFYLNKQQSINGNNFNNLQKVEFHSSHLDTPFWQDMAQENSNLSNITHLSFDECDINPNDKKLIESNYIPKIAAKLNNLIRFKCSISGGHSQHKHPTQVSVMLSSFLECLSRNDKTRESLQELDISLTQEWFLNIDKKAKNDINITVKYTTSDECVLNFKNLTNAVISFQLWDISPFHEFEYLDKLQFVKKALGVFCHVKPPRKMNISKSLGEDLSIDDNCNTNATDNVQNGNGNDCKHWTSNIKSLQLRNLMNLDRVLPGQFLTRFNDIEFKSLNTLHGTRCENGITYCDLQTKEFDSSQQLAHGMKLINNNASLLNSINGLYLKAAIDVESENNTQERDSYFRAICDILSQWIDDGNKNILLRFTLSNISDRESDYKYGQDFGVCLCNKINQFEKGGYVASSVGKGKFVSPYYGGNSEHFCNTFNINDRVRIGIHNPVATQEEVNQFELVIQLIKIGANFKHQGSLMPCNCHVRPWALPPFGTIDVFSPIPR